MKRKQKIPTVRFSVTLPETLLEYYRHVAEDTGLSVSKIILTTLRSKDKNVILLPLLYRQSVDEFNRLITEALAKNDVSPELKKTLENLRIQAETARVLIKRG